MTKAKKIYKALVSSWRLFKILRAERKMAEAATVLFADEDYRKSFKDLLNNENYVAGYYYTGGHCLRDVMPISDFQLTSIICVLRDGGFYGRLTSATMEENSDFNFNKTERVNDYSERWR